MMKIMKFGGTSVGSIESIKSVLEIIKASYDRGEKPMVVLSAMSGMTNLLNDMAEAAEKGEIKTENMELIEKKHFDAVKALLPVKSQNPVFTHLKLLFNELEDLLSAILTLKELSPQSKDLILSYGERCSAYMISKFAEEYLEKPVFVDARTLIKTNSNFGSAGVDEEKTSILIQALKQSCNDCTFFVTGFIGSDESGRTTTLGRGGSDYTAALLASELDADVIEIWTDVNGMMTADPRIVKKAFTLPELTYTEAMELSYFGAKVIYPPTMVPAFKKKIPIVIRNTQNPELEGTRIQFKNGTSQFPIKGISSISDISLLNISGTGIVGQKGFSGRLFTLLARNNINILLITQSSSEHSISFAVHPDDGKRAYKAIMEEFELELEAKKLSKPTVENGLSVIAIVGENMKQTVGISGKLFYALGRNGVNVRAIAQGSTEYNISVIIGKDDLAKALNAVHDAFFAELIKTLYVFAVGTGNIGSTLLNQIKTQQKFLSEQNNIEIKVMGMANTRKMLISEEGIDLSDWKNTLENEGKPADLGDFVERMKKMNLPSCVFIDNTASQVPCNYYEDIFKSNISIVASNKIANSGPLQDYQNLHETAKKQGVDFYYETNAGAGLPIIRVLKDLILSGDKILKIEAILSGTISYIFNNFRNGANFHEVVKKAQDLGYTEPDPRDDLNGKDFMRKMIILGRETGLKLEDKDVDLGQILPESCLKAADIPDFYVQMKNENSYFEELKKKAEAENKVLRYIGTLENGKVSVSLRMVDDSHPFYNLSGSDNIVSITTDRYKDTPLVVKGPGAGAEVTAGGVFADMVNVGSK